MNNYHMTLEMTRSNLLVNDAQATSQSLELLFMHLAKGDRGNGITRIDLTSTSGKVKTYTIYYDDGATKQFSVTDGNDGATGAQGPQGPAGPQGETGATGAAGADGVTPHIDSATKHWFIGTTDTGIKAEGTDATVTKAAVENVLTGEITSHTHPHDTTKQDVISDLTTIRSGASAGATAVQPSAITDMETQTHASQTYATKAELNGKSHVEVSATGTATDEVQYITIDGEEKKLAGGGGGTSDFDELTNRPKYNGSAMTHETNIPEVKTATWDGKQDTISDLATIRSNAAAGKTASDNLAGHTVAKNVPADAQFTDTVYDDTALVGRVTTIEGKESGWDGKYSKPSGGIPKTDLTSGVQESLSKADSALQSYTETDPVFVASAAHGISASDISNWNAKGTYSKPSDGIPSSDMASAVQTSLGKADSALQTKADVEGVLTGEISTHTHAHDTTKVNEPSSEGTSGQVLTTDGDGGRSWTTVQGGGGEPAAYIKDAAVANEVLTLTKKNDTTVTLDVSGKQNIIQVSAMPSQPHTGQIVQYIGATQGSLVNGAFYKCVYVDNSHIDSVETVPPGLISNVKIDANEFRSCVSLPSDETVETEVNFYDNIWTISEGSEVLYVATSAKEIGLSFNGGLENDSLVSIIYTSAPPPAYSWQRISFVFSDDVSSALPSATQSLTSESKASVRNNLDTQQTLEWLTNAEIDAMFN